MPETRFQRRTFVNVAVTSCGLCSSGWLRHLAHAAGGAGQRKSLILLWMAGGPSQTDTFDLKVGHPHGGPSKAIDTQAPGIQISEHLPRIAGQMRDLAI